MQIEKISFSVGYTVNLGNYESARFDVTVEGRIEEGEDTTDAFLELEHTAKVDLITSMLDTLQSISGLAVERVEQRLGLTQVESSETEE